MANCLILAGNYGSGKTELALNMALEYSKKGRTVLVDIDIVNPYFRSAEHSALLKSGGVRLIAPTYANTLVDVPVISAEVFAAFGYDYAVFDAGGDPVGASVLGSIAHRFENQEKLQFYYVVNARRPLQKTAEEVAEMMALIENKARRKVNGIINNTNLARETTVADLLYGREVCREVTSKTGVPVILTSGEKDVLREFKEITGEDALFPLKIYTRPNWLDSTVD